MKILIIGFLAFFSWAALSTHLYLCKIKHLCNEQFALQFGYDGIVGGDTLRKPLTPELADPPGVLSIYFAFDKSEFSSDAGIDIYFTKSKEFIEQDTLARLIITGYTDAIGTCVYNKALGYRRAQSLQDYFGSKGMDLNKVVIESKGEEEPEGDNNTPDGRAKNRRTIVTINK